MQVWLELATAALAAVVAVLCYRSARGMRIGEKRPWMLLAGGAAAVAVGRVGLLAWPDEPGMVRFWTSLDCFLFIGFYAAAFSVSDARSPRTARAAHGVDTVLLSFLLFVVSYYVLDAGIPRAWAGTLLGLSAGGSLLARRMASPSRRWLGFAALCHGASEAIDNPLPQAAALLFLALAARAAPGTAAAIPEDGPVERPLISVWRELAVPVVVFFGLLGIVLVRHVAAAGVMAIYAALVLARQFLVQMENRDLGIDLRQESQGLRLLVDNIHDAVIKEDLTGRILFANDRLLELFGVTREQALRARLDDFIPAEDRFLSAHHALRRTAAHMGPERFEFRGVRKDGVILHLESSVVPVRVGGIVRGFQSVIRDITERRRAEERQRELVQRLEFFVNHMPLGCIVWDLDSRILEWNNSAARIFGWSASEVFGRQGPELLVPPQDRPALAAAWRELQRAGSSNHYSVQNLTKDRGLIECEWFHTSLVDHSGSVVAVASMIQDVTDRKNLEAQLRQSQKMEAVGVLAGGIAHDFNNVLTIILGNLSVTLMRLGSNHPSYRGLRDAEKAAERATGLVRQMLGFSRKNPGQPRPMSLNASVKETLDLVRSSLDPRIEIEILTEPALWPVEADPGQMHQVLVNLCVNARDAMPGGGRLTITTANLAIDEKYCQRHPEARAGEYVTASVWDTGPGMDEATRARVFEPFFTTKEVGKGTGLGLAMVYGIVLQHGGWVTVESEPGRGAGFTILLPRSMEASQPESAVPDTNDAGGPETILMVDDEDMIRNLAGSILKSVGYHVLEAQDGSHALEVFERHRAEIKLVLLDMMMPRKSGRDVLEEIHRLAPDLPVVLASGYAPVGFEELAALGAKAYIEKPYRPSELIHTIRRVLDEGRRDRDPVSPFAARASDPR